MSKIRVFRHFLQNRLLKVSNFLHDGRRQYGASFDYGAIVGKNLNQLLIRSLDRGHALLRNFGIEIRQFSVYIQIFRCESVKFTVADHFRIFTRTYYRIN